MILEEFVMAKDEGGGYLGYDCVVIDDNGKRHEVRAVPRQHASASAIARAAYDTLKNQAVAERESMIDQAAKVLAQAKQDKIDAEVAAAAAEFSEEDIPLEGRALPADLEGYTLPSGDPDDSWVKGQIKLYLWQKEISYEDKMTKAKLLALIPSE